MKLLSILLLFLTLPFISEAEELTFNNLTTNSGLTQHDISSIIQDSYGFIWISTFDGLNRYDGYTMEHFYYSSLDNNSVCGNRISKLFEDSKKRLWIGTDGNGICYYDLIKENFVKVTRQYSNHIIDIKESKDGKIYFASQTEVFYYDDKDKSIKFLPKITPSITAIEILQNNHIIISTNKGIYEEINNEFHHITTSGKRYYSTLFIDSKKYIWTFSNSQLFKLYTAKDGSLQINDIIDVNIPHRPYSSVTKFCEDKNNNIWFGSHQDGLFKITSNNIISQYKKDPIKLNTLCDNDIISLYNDVSNVLWIGTTKGVSFINLDRKKFNTLKLDNLQTPYIRNLLVTKNQDIYFSDYKNKAYRYSHQTKKASPINSDVAFHSIYASKQLNNGLVVLGTDNGIYEQKTIHKNDFRKKRISSDKPINDGHFLAICEDSYGQQYFASKGNVYIQDTKQEIKTIEISKHPKDPIFCLFYDDEEHCLWIGATHSGIYKLTLNKHNEKRELLHYNTNAKDPYNIHDNHIWTFLKTEDKTLWVGCDGGLLKKSPRSNQFTYVKHPKILDKKIISLIEDEDHELWLGNSQGLINYNPSDNTVKKYSHIDGLQSNTFTEAVGKSPNGQLYFGGINGINFFYPKNIYNNPYPIQIAFTSFKINNKIVKPGNLVKNKLILEKSINETERINLPYHLNNFSFEFTGIHFANPELNQFKYQLKGYDKEYILTDSKHRIATYTNIPPGKYTFWINAANNDLVWHPIGKKIDIYITASPYKSRLAYAIYLLFTIGIIILIFNIFHRNKIQKIQRTQEIQEIEKERQLNLLKMKFYTDISHEFKTPLSLIKGPVRDLLEEDNQSAQARFCYKIINKNTERMLLLVNQLTDMAKINAGKNVLQIANDRLDIVINNTIDSFAWEAKNQNIYFERSIPVNNTCYFDKDKIQKILYNIISNALKYTPEEGIISVKLEITKDKIANITISDTGSGISDEDKKKVFMRFHHGKERGASGIGLNLTNSLVKAHKGKISISDADFGGTRFNISLPVDKNSYTEEEILTKQIAPESYVKNPKIYTKQVVKKEKKNANTILIVEDDYDLRNYIKSFLEEEYFVITAKDGMVGIEQAEKHLPDLIISDIMMPKLSGIQLVNFLKENIKTSHIPIILLTAKTSIESEREGLRTGAINYIHKPFDKQTILLKIKNILNLKTQFQKIIFTNTTNKNEQNNFSKIDNKLIDRLTQAIEDNLDNTEFTSKDLVKVANMSRNNLHLKLKSLTNNSASSFIRMIRIKHATDMFNQGENRVKEVAFSVGFNSLSYFTSCFKDIHGISPSDYIKSNKQQSTNSGAKEKEKKDF